eukprot:SM000016S01862  [mRNA]  locus=s16:323459:331808:+ [translate_table: standard]
MADPDSEVDWVVVEEELNGIPEVWKQSRFDSLPHVVEVLTSRDPEGALRALQQQSEAIEDLVDDVVQGYHNGFNRAIHNYSQILKLFGESASKMSGLRESLVAARLLLSTKQSQLQHLWYRSITLRNVLTLIDQIDNVSKVPARIEMLITQKLYYAAVQLHLQSTSMIEREGIQGLGALRNVQNDLSKLRSQLFFKVLEDLQLHLYGKGEYSWKSNVLREDDDVSDVTVAPVPDMGPSHASPSPHPSVANMSRRTRSFRRTSSGNERFVGHFDPEGVDGGDGGYGPDSPASVTGQFSEMSTRSIGSAAKKPQSRAPPPWLAEAIPNDFTETMGKSEAIKSVQYIQTMVECLALLGKVAAAGTILAQRLKASIKDLIVTEVREKASAADLARPRVDQVAQTPVAAASSTGLATPPPSKPGNRSVAGLGLGSISGLRSPIGARVDIKTTAPTTGPFSSAQLATQELLNSILDRLAHVLENHVVAGQTLEAKTRDGVKIGSPQQNTHVAPDSDADREQVMGGYSVAYIWACLQGECQHLLYEIVRASPDGTIADAGHLPRAHDTRSNGGAHGSGGLTFSFRYADSGAPAPGVMDNLPGASLGGDGLRHVRGRRGEQAYSADGYGTAAILPDRGVELISACYKPLLQFVDKASRILPADQAISWTDALREFLDAFIRDQFLPTVGAQYRSKVADAFAGPAAFRLQGRALTSYEKDVEKGRPVLQGPLSAERLIAEVLRWAQVMPVYSTSFLEVVQVLLDRILERCRGVYTEAVLGSLSSGLATRSDMEGLMRQQVSSALLSPVELPPITYKEARDNPPLDSEAYEIDMELHNMLLALRPIREEQLMTDMHKIVLLAALSDTLEYMADSITLFSQTGSFIGTPLQRRSPLKLKDGGPPRAEGGGLLIGGLNNLATKYRALAVDCLRTLRLEVQLHTIYYLQSMTSCLYEAETSAEDPEDFVISLTTQLTRMDEEMSCYISPMRRSYVFGSICSLASTAFIKEVANIQSINSLGVRQICCNCIALQQTLASMGCNGSSSVQQSLDRVRTYYELLNLPIESLLAFVTEHDRLFSVQEYSNLLKVNVPGREVQPDAAQRIARIVAP